MKINNGGFLSNIQAYSRNNKFLEKIHEKLATAKKLNRASDGASAIAMAKELEKQVRGFKQGSSNIGDAMGALKIAEGTGNEISSMLQRQRELAIQAGNGTLNDNDRSALNQEYQALNSEIDRIAKSSNFNNQNVADGSSPLSDGTGQIQTGPGANDQTTLDAIDMTASGIGAGGDISSVQGAQSALSQIDGAISNTNGQRSTLGAQINAFEHNQRNNENSMINTAQGQSMLEDLDIGEGMMEKAKANILAQSSASAMRSFNDISRNSMMSLLS